MRPGVGDGDASGGIIFPALMRHARHRNGPFVAALARADEGGHGLCPCH